MSKRSRHVTGADHGDCNTIAWGGGGARRRLRGSGPAETVAALPVGDGVGTTGDFVRFGPELSAARAGIPRVQLHGLLSGWRCRGELPGGDGGGGGGALLVSRVRPDVEEEEEKEPQDQEVGEKALIFCHADLELRI